MHPHHHTSEHSENPGIHGAHNHAAAPAGSELRALKLKTYVGILGTSAILGLSFPEMLGDVSKIFFPYRDYLLPLLAVPVQLWLGWKFYLSAIASARKKQSNMDTLVALGTVAALVFSVCATFLPQSFFPKGLSHVYYDTGVTIITLVVLGKYLEALAKNRAGNEIKKLITLQPKMVRLIRGSMEMEVPVETIKKDDLVRVRPGERIGVDGKVEEGYSTVNESMITGESIPAEKIPGSVVAGGTVNGSGGLLLRATRVGKESVLARIIALVQQAQSSRAPVQRLADQISSYFVPAVLAVAVVSAAAWYVFAATQPLASAIAVFISVLIIACPCALGLATPVAVLVGVGRAAVSGILIKDAESLERLEKIDTVVFDKTGTLTTGRPVVTDIVPNPLSPVTVEQILRMAASVEQGSEHAVGASIISAAEAKNLSLVRPERVRAVPGKGIEAYLGRQQVHLGTQDFMSDLLVPIEHLHERSAKLASEGKTVVYVSLDRLFLGMIAVADEPRAEAAETVRMLHERGLTVVMLSGDRRITATALAHRLGIERVMSEFLPEDKAKEIKKLQAAGHTVAMVGDGINDAAALAGADIGIAMGSGTGIAVETAGVTLLGTNLKKIPKAIALSEKTMGTIRGNFFWAFFYNILGVPVAAGILYPFFGILLNPTIAAAAMALSSLFVVINSLRLRHITL